MFKYPFIEPQELPIVSEEVNIEQGELETLFNGKKSIESIYAELLAKDLSLDGINSIFKILLSKKILKDKIYLESDVLSAEKIDKYKSQIETFSYFSQSQEEDNYYNLLFGLSCQEKLFKSKIHLIGNTPLIFELNKKLKLLGIVDIKISEKIETLSNSDLLIFHFNRYKEDLLINALEYCKANNVPFLPVNNASFGAEIGPFFISTENSCSLCLIDRKKSVVGDFYFQDNTKFNFNISIGADLLILEVLKYLTGVAPNNLKNKVAHYNYITGLIKYHSVLKNPSCKICSANVNKPKRKLWEGII